MKLEIGIEKKYLIPRIELILKVFVAVLIINYLVAPFIFDNITLLNQLNIFWRSFFTSLIAVYLALIFKIKLFGREYF